MLRLFDTEPDRNVQEAEFKRLLGYPGGHVLEERAGELAKAARQWYEEHGRPWIYVQQIESLEWTGGSIRINGPEFISQPFQEQLAAAGAHSAVLVAVSAGPECEEKARSLWQEGKPDEYFFMEMYGSAVVEHLTALANGRICAWADQHGMAALPHYSPGYSGWDVSDQARLWALFRRAEDGSFTGQLEVLDTGMLRPKKSLLAVVGLTRELDRVRAVGRLVPCENCSLPGCQYRRAPYTQFPEQLEDARSLQAGAGDGSARPVIGGSGLEHDAHYSLNVKALRKWSLDRLRLEFLPDGSVQACFRYEGMTCSNMGRAFEMDYAMLLAPSQDRYRIMEATCGPVPGDSGHACQCEYLKDPVSFMQAISVEKPLLGRPLNEVLSWTRAYSPSGCYCDLDRRNHKWGLVFEVIHYALVQHQKGNTLTAAVLPQTTP